MLAHVNDVDVFKLGHSQVLENLTPQTSSSTVNERLDEMFWPRWPVRQYQHDSFCEVSEEQSSCD